MRHKMPLPWVMLLVVLVALGVFYYATTAVINPAFNKIEQRDVRQNLSRAVNELSSRTSQVQSKVIDWSDWDDTYAFVENHNPAYIKSNLQNSALTDLDINFMLFYNQKQQLVEAKSVDDNGNTIPVPAGLNTALAPGSPLLAKSVNSESSGLIVVPGNVIQYFDLPILTSEGNGPIHGTLVFALFLSPDEVSNIATVTNLNVQFWRLNDPTKAADITAIVGNHPSKPVVAVRVVSATKIIGYQTINDTYGRPAVVARVVQARAIHNVAQTALHQYFLIILLDTLAAIAVVGVLAYIINQKDHTIALKNEFFSIASHELRTPLTVIRDYNQLMKFKFSQTINNPEFDHMVGNVDKTSAQLIDLVNVFLDAARLERGKIPFNITPFSLHEVTTNLLTELSTTAKAKNLTIATDIPTDLPLIKGDKARVQQVITNLIGNAMKFTEAGGITIKALAKNRRVTVYITDTGRGMSKPEQHNLFKRFTQTRQKDALQGSGLGLFISKKLIEQMGGSIRLESSELGVGTTISFNLPVADGPLAPATPQAPAPKPPAPPQLPTPPPRTVYPKPPHTAPPDSQSE